MEWMPIETAPMDGREIMVWVPKFQGEKIQIAHYVDVQSFSFGKIVHEEKGWGYRGWVDTVKSALPTLWCPLPLPPED